MRSSVCGRSDATTDVAERSKCIDVFEKRGKVF